MASRAGPSGALIAAVALLIGAGTGAEEPRSGAPQLTFDGLQRVEGGPFEHEFARPGADLSGYQKVLLDEVELSYHREFQHGEIFEEDVKRMRRFFRKAVEKKVGELYPLVTEPGPNVLRVRASVVDLRFSSTADTSLEGPAAQSEVRYALIPAVTVIAELRDSRSGQLLYRVGHKEPWNPDRPQAWSHTTVFWGEVETSFDRWADRLREMILHARTRKAQQ